MSCILVSLISDQSIPNLLFLKEMPEQDRYIFITTAQMEKKRRSENLIKVAGLPTHKVEKIEVSPESLIDVLEKLESLRLSHSNDFIVHLTGGNKIMALAAHQFFVNRKSTMYYAPIGKNGFEKIYPLDGDSGLKKFSQTVSLIDYLTVYGVDIKNPEDINKTSQKKSVTESMYNSSWASDPLFKNLTDYKSHYEKEHRGKSPTAIKISDIVGLDDALQKHWFITSQPEFLNQKEIFFLAGGWFEEYIYLKLKAHFNLDSDKIGINVSVQKQGAARNECDVMLILNNDLYVVECKSRLTKIMFDQTAYKLTAIKKDFGLQARSYLFASEDYRDRSGNLHDNAEKRAKHLDLHIRDRKEIDNGNLI